MRIGVSVFLLVVFLGLLTSLLVIKSQISYAEVTSPAPAGGKQEDALDSKKEKKGGSMVKKDGDTSSSDYAQLGSHLLKYLVLSLVLEMALTVVFNWEVFIKYLEGKGWKTPIAILFAGLMAYYFELDIMQEVLTTLGSYKATGTGADFIGKLVTAFVLAGGNDGIFRVLTKAGVRDRIERMVRAAA